ncbi:MAG: methionine--tRNA ligase [Nitrospinae bacterium]|nr:methionine--tRNA ligase [Nitrospinota bacterium]
MPDSPLVITAALPYANGSIHLGHMVEYIQADIFARYHRMAGHKALFFCADDTHGAPIMIRARNEGTTPEAVIERFHKEHLEDFSAFNIKFDNYHSTNSEENRVLSEEIYLKLKSGGHITTRNVEQAYCDTDKMFLPDRFVRGVCPRCGAENQYGDSCDVCGAHYASTELKEARCSLCGAPPSRKMSSHYFFRVSDFIPALENYLEGDALQPEIKNFLATWLKEGLRDWDISRDGPYFGFKIPGEEDKYFYVWLDAPIGYISAAKNWAGKTGGNFDALWKSGDAKIHHFIGKDIVYFHTLFWIPMLEGSGYKKPDKIHVHGFLTINGEKMSKSKGTFLNARDYLSAGVNPELLRYYYATKLKHTVDDLDLNFQDFVFRVNAELVNKVANLGSRTITILNKNATLDNRLAGELGESQRGFLNEFIAESGDIAKEYEACDFSLAIKRVCRLADKANQYIDEKKPWDLKNDPAALSEVLAVGINAFRLLAIYLKPVVPAFVEKVERILKVEPFEWADSLRYLTGHQIGQFERLMDRVDMKDVEKVMAAAQKVEAPAKPAPAKKAKEVKVEEKPEEKGLIDFDDFSKVDLRTAKVVAAEKIEKAEKLLKLTIDVGGVQRPLVAGIAKHYTAEEMVGKTIVIVANLKPRKLMGIESQGMLLAVNDGERLAIVSPVSEMPSGIKVS